MADNLLYSWEIYCNEQIFVKIRITINQWLIIINDTKSIWFYIEKSSYLFEGLAWTTTCHKYTVQEFYFIKFETKKHMAGKKGIPRLNKTL